MIDLHCHLLPGVDDGPCSMSDALGLAAAAVADGITLAVVTPHIYPQRWDNRCSTLCAPFAAFQRALAEHQIPLEVRLGGEVRLSPDILPLLEQQELPFLGNSTHENVVLLEMPDTMIPIGSDRLIKVLRSRGIRPLLAHPERNHAVMNDINRLAPFVDLGCWVQITAGSVLGKFGTTAAKTARALMQRDWVQIMATDCHNLRYRPPQLAEARLAVARQFNEAYADRLVCEWPSKIVGLR